MRTAEKANCVKEGIMFDFIRGTVVKKDPEYCVLDVGGVGFRIYTSLTSAGAAKEGETALFYTYLAVKEDDLSLYGFLSEDELYAFKLLISVSGVGPKVAASILSQMPAVEFCMAVISGNHKAISKAKGVGPKLAQRIVLDLKDKVKKHAVEDAAASTGAGEEMFKPQDDSAFNEAVEALMVLGYNIQKAKQAVSLVYEDGMRLEDIVRLALKSSV